MEEQPVITEVGPQEATAELLPTSISLKKQETGFDKLHLWLGDYGYVGCSQERFAKSLPMPKGFFFSPPRSIVITIY